MPTGRSYRSVQFGASMSAAASGSSTAAGAVPGVGGKGVGGGSEVKNDGDEGGPGALSAATRRSLRTARDRGDVKYKAKKGKPSKSKAPSSLLPASSATAAGVGKSGGGDPRGVPKLLRLSKLLADRAVGSRSEVRFAPTLPYVCTTLVWRTFERPESCNGEEVSKRSII